jgi:hypothetical protein
MIKVVLLRRGDVDLEAGKPLHWLGRRGSDPEGRARSRGGVSRSASIAAPRVTNALLKTAADEPEDGLTCAIVSSLERYRG